LRGGCGSDFEVFGAGFLASYIPLFLVPCSVCLMRLVRFFGRFAVFLGYVVGVCACACACV